MSGALVLALVWKGRTGKPCRFSASILGSPMLLASAPDDLRSPFIDDGGQAVALQLPADLVEAFQGDHFAIAGIEDGDGGVVFAASPIDPGDIGVTRLRLFIGRGGGGIADAAENLSAVIAELGFVFGFPDECGGIVFEVRQFVGMDEWGIGGAEMK